MERKFSISANLFFSRQLKSGASSKWYGANLARQIIARDNILSGTCISEKTRFSVGGKILVLETVLTWQQ
jgi:hypothetical protein